MMTFKDLKKLVELPSYKEQRVPTVKALEVSGVPVVTEKVLENHGRNRQPYPALPGKSAGAESNFGYENAFGKAAGKQGVRGTPQHPAVCS